MKTPEKDKISKSNRSCTTSDDMNTMQKSNQVSIPYHRTSGASFCPNGNTLGGFDCVVIFSNRKSK